MSDVINKLLIYSGLNAKAFADKIGLDRPQAIYDILKGKTKSISPSMSNKILSVFPEVSRTWLLTGEGDMLSADAPASTGSGDRSVIERLLSQLEEKDRQIAALIELLKK